MKELSIYIHIPFCIKKCHYCDFLSAPADDAAQEEYLHALIREIQTEAAKYKEYRVVTIFIGGGTPTAVNPELLCNVLATVKAYFVVGEDAEISMEANPGTVTKDSLLQYRAAGVNRLSIGLQSAKDNELILLGRIHSYADFEKTYYVARECGFTNVNVDVMSALPGQTPDSYRETLKKVLSLTPPPEHISAYSLIIEEGTPFFERYGSEQYGSTDCDKEQIAEGTGNFPKAELPCEEDERTMYYLTEEVLEGAGYYRYEISNYSRPGYECRHNLVYWQRGNYAGLGLGASSMVENVRFQNVSDMTEYLTGTEKIAEETPLSRKEQMEEFMFLGLRLMEGVSKDAFFDCFGISMEEVYGEVIKKNVSDSLLKDGERLCLTKKGVDVSNYVMAQFLLD